MDTPLKLALTICTCMLDMASNPPGTRESRPVEMIASVVSKVKQIGTCFHADIHTFERRLHILMSMNEDPIALQRHQSRRIGSNLFVRKLKGGLKRHCNTT